MTASPPLDFGALPPESNSGRMYAGPGSAPIMAAAAAWDLLTAELNSTATRYMSVITALTGSSWLNRASQAMASAVTPYISWLSTAATLAAETAHRARAAAEAYEAAFALTVPPPVIAANRLLLMTLITTNFIGQNTPAIAATEAQYAEMWAQDAAAMYGYAGAWYPTPLSFGRGGGGRSVSANLASASKVGGLSVPSKWAYARIAHPRHRRRRVCCRPRRPSERPAARHGFASGSCDSR
jgi:hypothetical protein